MGRFGLYIHWPFCAAKCPYCDFNSHVRSDVAIDQWRRALLSEVDRVAVLTPDHVLSTIFFGGGTPSLMPPALVGDLTERAQSRWRTTNAVEITLEANPTSIEVEKFQGFKAAGVNRVSMGVQALNDDDLKRLGRMHDVAEALRGLDIARRTFDRVSIDLIYARQNQTLRAWENELRQALDLGLDHLSLYQLTVEPGTIFAKRHQSGSLRGLPDEDLSADLWDLTQELCEAKGLWSYEVSNHAQPGAESQHNLIYWQGGDWAGIGPGAHGRLTIDTTRFATETASMPEAWLERVEKKGSGETVCRALEQLTVAEERVLMGLRLREGVKPESFDWVPPLDVVQDLTSLGLLTYDGTTMSVTDAGRPVLNAIIEKLLT